MKFKALKAVHVDGLGDVKAGAEFDFELTRSLARQIKHRSVVAASAVAPAEKPKADGGEGDGGSAGDDLTSKSHAELKDLATAKGFEFPGNVSRAKLLEMLTAE
jgi:hypothetical protein